MKSTVALVSCSLFMLIFPIIPSPCFLLLAIVNLFLVAVGIHFVGFGLCLLPFGSLHHVLILKLSDFFKGHGWLVSVLLPDLCDQIFLLHGGTHALMYLVFGWNLPHLDFG